MIKFQKLLARIPIVSDNITMNLGLGEYKAGFTLVEAVVALALVAIAIAGSLTIISSVNSHVSQSLDTASISTFGMEYRNYLKKTYTNGISLCMAHPTVPALNFTFSPRAPGQVMNAIGSAAIRQLVLNAKVTPGNAANAVVLANQIPFSNQNYYGGGPTSVGTHGRLNVLRTIANSFTVRKEIKAYVIPQPQVVSVATNTLQNFMWVLSGLIETEFYRGPIPTSGGLNPKYIFKSRVPFNIVVRQINGVYSVLDCGVDSLARTTAFVESCKAMGNHFVYVQDRATSGQCYIPRYRGVATGIVESAPSEYIPLRAFFCEGAFSGKSLNFPFCTGDF